MSTITVQVFLAAYSYSFNVSISSESTIHDFKRTVTDACIGSPETSGQRIIYKGRLLADTEVVGSIWKVSEGPHVCHLAVHPSAWRGEPPAFPTSRPSINSSCINVSAPRNDSQISLLSPVPPPLYMPSYPQTTYPYIQYMHTNALRILARQQRIPWPVEYGDMDTARAATRRGIEAANRGWPSFLNSDFPPSAPEDGTQGVRYRYTCIDNLPYLSLESGDDIPTPIQNHAIRVLSYTFPLLCVYSPVQTQQYSNLIQVNPPSRFLAPLPVQPQAPQPVARPAIPIRPLILPFVMLTIRTAFLVYFFQPARKPVFGLLVFMWLTWEVMNVLREALRGIHQERNNGGNNDNLRGLNQPGNQPNLILRRDNGLLADSQETLLNHLAHFNLATEDQFVQPNATPNPLTPPPSIFHRMKTFLVLLFLTAYPGLWDRRRTALRTREIAVRSDANAREARALRRAEREENRRQGLVVEDEPDNSQEQPSTPKPYWVAEYIRRVRSGDWVDDT